MIAAWGWRSAASACLAAGALLACQAGAVMGAEAGSATADAGDPDSAPEGGPRTWATPAGWRVAAPSEDPFAGTVPGAVVCPATEYALEGGGGDAAAGGGYLELLTTTCNYGTVVQPSLTALAAGDSLTLALWHNPLTRPDGSLAEVWVHAAGQVLTSWQVSLPADASVLTRTLDIVEPVPAGSAVYFHVHNHGANAWRIGQWRVGAR